MNLALAVFGSLGGITTFGGAVWVVVRAVFRQSSAVRENTEATGRLTDAITKLDGKFSDHETRISRLEGSRP